MGGEHYRVVLARVSIHLDWIWLWLTHLAHPTKIIWLCIHSRSNMHSGGRYVVFFIMLMLVHYDADMSAEMEQDVDQ